MISSMAVTRAALAFLLMTIFPAPAIWSAPGWTPIDGDTILSPDGRKIRVIGVDTPEMPPHDRCPGEAAAALRAKVFVADALRRADRVDLQERGLDKYRRTLAVVLVDGRDLAALVIAAGHGREYHGERRKGWC